MSRQGWSQHDVLVSTKALDSLAPKGLSKNLCWTVKSLKSLLVLVESFNKVRSIQIEMVWHVKTDLKTCRDCELKLTPCQKLRQIKTLGHKFVEIWSSLGFGDCQDFLGYQYLLFETVETNGDRQACNKGYIGMSRKSQRFQNVESLRANPINISMPTSKFWSWHNYDKSLFQSYKAVFITQNYAKRHFLT